MISHGLQSSSVCTALGCIALEASFCPANLGARAIGVCNCCEVTGVRVGEAEKVWLPGELVLYFNIGVGARNHELECLEG
jgi:hypothetical protein